MDFKATIGPSLPKCNRDNATETAIEMETELPNGNVTEPLAAEAAYAFKNSRYKMAFSIGMCLVSVGLIAFFIYGVIYLHRQTKLRDAERGTALSEIMLLDGSRPGKSANENTALLLSTAYGESVTEFEIDN